MSDILSEIVTRRRATIVRLQSERPSAEVAAQLTCSDRDFLAALRAQPPAFILEYKQASPSRGTIRAPGDMATVAAAYAPHAAAISVLTEPDYFQGSFADLQRMRTLLPQPILCKDFIVEPYQVLLARAAGADAILLILAILSDQQYHELAALAATWGMAVLTEIASAPEQQRAVRLRAPLVGINNRNLHDFSIDPRRTQALAAGLPEECLVVSESGFTTNADVRRVAEHADGFLVGSSLMRHAVPAVAVKRLIYGEHKVCGLTRPADAQAAAEAGAVYGGVIIAERSPRRVELDRVPEIFADSDLQRVLVTQDQPLEPLAPLAEKWQLAAIQLHGRETLDQVRDLRARLTPQTQIWRALPVAALDREGPAWLAAGVDRFVIDHMTTERQGGTGTPFDWSLLPAAGRQQMMVAGGINADNVQDALRLGVAGVDLNSGVESAPGLKSPALLREVFQRIRASLPRRKPPAPTALHR